MRIAGWLHLILFAADEADPTTLAAWKSAAEQVMAGHGHVQLVIRGHLPTTPSDGVYADVRSEAHNRYGVWSPSLYLIRPDKYVGHRTDDIDFAALRHYFRTLAGAPGPPPWRRPNRPCLAAPIVERAHHSGRSSMSRTARSTSDISAKDSRPANSARRD